MRLTQWIGAGILTGIVGLAGACVVYMFGWYLLLFPVVGFSIYCVSDFIFWVDYE